MTTDMSLQYLLFATEDMGADVHATGLRRWMAGLWPKARREEGALDP